MKRLILLPFLLLMTACGAAQEARPEPQVVVQETLVPISVSCVPSNYTPARPEYMDSDTALRAAIDAAERYQLLWAGRAQRIARETENEIVIAGCIKSE